MDLCGHATLAAAFALWEEGRVDPGLPVRFSTASGVLTCRRDGEGWVAMDFPAEVMYFCRRFPFLLFFGDSPALWGAGRGWWYWGVGRPCALAGTITTHQE